MELKWLEDFLCLTRLSSFSTAAAKRNVTQSAFSRRIKALEKWLGVPLIDRSTYPVTLTEAGLRFRVIAEQVRTALYDVRDDFQDHRQHEENTVVFTAPHSLSLAFFPYWLKTLEKSFGRLDTQMIAENMITCIQVMTEGRSDFLMSYAHPDVPLELDPMSFDYLKLDVDRMVPVSAPLPDGKPAFVLPGDGKSEIPFLAYHSTSFLGQVLKVFLRRQRKSLHLAQCYEDALAEGLKAMALEGRGLTWLPESTIGDTIGTGKLVRAGPKDWDIPLEIRIYCSSDARRPAAAGLWTFLQRALGQ